MTLPVANMDSLFLAVTFVVAITTVYDNDPIKRFKIRLSIPLENIDGLLFKQLNLKDLTINGLSGQFVLQKIFFNDDFYDVMQDDEMTITLSNEALMCIIWELCESKSESESESESEDTLHSALKDMVETTDTKCLFKWKIDTHWDCYCKTSEVCGCGCDPLHDGW